ncbi:MAG: peptide ABC transporter substrate-binding protein [Christensenellales bacterium]
MVLIITCCACGSSGDDSNKSVQTIPHYTLPPVKEDPIPIAGGELVFPIPKNPASLNPLKIKNIELFNLFSLIYEQPVRIGVDGTVQPELAETWEVDSTGTVWTFHLRKGVRWQKDYGVFTSQDVIYTIGLIKSYMLGESTYAQYNSLITNFAAEDDYTVKITLLEPGNAAVYFMTFPIICKAYCEGENIDLLKPVGTGPYLIVDYDTDEQMTLQANDLWWKEAPYIRTLTAKCFPDHDTELAAFEQNFLNFITTSMLTVETYKKYGVTSSIDYLTQYYDCLVPNVTTGLFSDVKIRQAVAYALDKRDIVSTALLGHAVAADYPVAPDSYLSGDSSNIYEYNLQKALSLFEEAGWKDRNDDGILERVEENQPIDLTIDLLIPLNKEDTYRLDVAENIASQLLECGIKVNIIEKPTEESLNEYKQSLINRDFDLAFCSLYLDQNPDITFMIGTGESANYGGFSDADIDILLKNCKASLSEDDMKQAYLALEKRFIETMPQISLYFKTNALIYDASINIPDAIRDMNIYTTIPEWYLYVKNAEA